MRADPNREPGFYWVRFEGRDGVRRGAEEAGRHLVGVIGEAREALSAARKAAGYVPEVPAEFAKLSAAGAAPAVRERQTAGYEPPPIKVALGPISSAQRKAMEASGEKLAGPQQRIVDAIAWLEGIGVVDPWKLPSWNGVDPENRAFMERWFRDVDLVVAAWGNQPPAVRRKIALAELVLVFLEIAPRPIHCIGTTQRGDPLHPSRAPYTERPLIWRTE